jgi:hypothetical protein
MSNKHTSTEPSDITYLNRTRVLLQGEHKFNYLASRTVFSDGGGGGYASTLSEPIVSLRSDGGCGMLLPFTVCSGVGLTGSLFTQLPADTAPSKGILYKA